MSQTLADTVVHSLEQIGVQQIFGLIGDSPNPLADAVRRSDMEWSGVRHEEGAALAKVKDALLAVTAVTGLKLEIYSSVLRTD